MNNLNRAAWWCPSCNAYHAPHCETCTGKSDAVSRRRIEVAKDDVSVTHIGRGDRARVFKPMVDA